jgi:serine/threonine protein kinase
MTPQADLAGRTLAHYRLVERIGSGGMGVVYRAEDSHLDRIVAIKVLPADAVGDPDRRRRFVQEAKAASALNHPNIVHVYDIGSADGIDFIAMECVSRPNAPSSVSTPDSRASRPSAWASKHTSPASRGLASTPARSTPIRVSATPTPGTTVSPRSAQGSEDAGAGPACLKIAR